MKGQNKFSELFEKLMGDIEKGKNIWKYFVNQVVYSLFCPLVHPRLAAEPPLGPPSYQRMAVMAVMGMVQGWSQHLHRAAEAAHRAV